MDHEIGSAAGKIWDYLNKNGQTAVSKVVKETGLASPLAQRAIGWLAREGKVRIEKDGRAELIGLH